MPQIKIQPDYSGEYYWDSYCKTLDIELKQCIDEGLDITDFELLFKKAIEMPYSKAQADLADEIFEKIINAEIRSDYKYNEPSDLDGIKALRKPYTYEKNVEPVGFYVYYAVRHIYFNIFLKSQRNFFKKVTR